MTALHRFALQVLLLVALAAGGWLWHLSEVSDARQAGWSAAVAAGKEQRDRDASAALAAERTRREQDRLKDEAANRKEMKNAETLAAAQRRVRAGTDVLRCPAASTVQPAAEVADGSATDEVQADRRGAELVPDVAADVLGNAAAVAGLVRKYDDLYERAEACIALNNGPTPVGESGE